MDNEYIADDEFPRRISRATMIFEFTQPRTISNLLGVTGLMAIMGGFFLGSAWGALALGGLGVLFVLLSAGLSYRRVLRRMQWAQHVGVRYGSAFGHQTMTLRSPLASSEVAYLAYDRVIFRGDFVYLRPRGGTAFTVFPAELFPANERAALQARITGATSAALRA